MGACVCRRVCNAMCVCVCVCNCMYCVHETHIVVDNDSVAFSVRFVHSRYLLGAYFRSPLPPPDSPLRHQYSCSTACLAVNSCECWQCWQCIDSCVPFDDCSTDALREFLYNCKSTAGGGSGEWLGYKHGMTFNVPHFGIWR